MGTSTRGRIAGLLALVLATSGVAFAVTDGSVVSPRTVTPQGEVYPPFEGSAEAAGAAHDELGAQASSSGDGGENSDAAKRGGKLKHRGDASEDETAVLAALIPAGSGGGPSPLACSDTNSCVNRVGRLVTDVADRLPELPKLRECVSSIGGEAMCFDFGNGNYLVGDGPADGQTELGFCTSSGYYYVSGPSLGGGTGAACPGERAGERERRAGRGKPPTTRECESLRGGEAKCFDFGGGNYIVSDSLADGKGELGFCTDSGYYYISAPSAKGDAGVKCPGARAG